MSSHAVRDTAALTGRTLRHVTRSPDTIITTAVTPIALLLLFVFVLGGAIDTGSESYVDYLLPGVLLITIASGVSYTAFRLFQDKQGGIIDRFRSMPIARSALLWAHVLTSMAANVLSLLLVLVVGLLIGLRPAAGPLAWLGFAGLLLLVTLTLTWVAVIPGLVAKTVDGASAFSYPLIFLPFISSAFVPTDSMPAAVRAFAEHQPVTAVVDTLRALLTGQPVEDTVWPAVAWCIAILVAAQIVALRLYRRTGR